MSMNPVFHSDLDALKSRLRLSAIDAGDASAVVDTAIEEVRLGLFAALGSSLVTEIQGVVISDDPVTDDELKALRARNVEYLWVRMILLQRLPSLFLQAADQARQSWNDEGITREAGSDDLRRQLRLLQSQINDGINEILGEDTGIRAVCIGPEETPPQPGASIMPSWAGGVQ